MQALRRVFDQRVPGGADLVCYWFEKARAQIANHGLGAAGLVATNSIRGGKNRQVLDAICETMRIFDAWGNEPWVNDGAKVHVSLVAFSPSDLPVSLNGSPVPRILPNLDAGSLSSSSDITGIGKLRENLNTAYVGVQRNGPFDVDGDAARQWLRLPNASGQSNAEVLVPCYTAVDLVRRPIDRWLIDFGLNKQQRAVTAFEWPYAHVEREVRPTRIGLRRSWHATYWWLFGDPRPALRRSIHGLARYLVTPQISKHRVFRFIPAAVLTENANIAVARADDTTFGILQARFHTVWALKVGTSLEDRPRYTNSTTFETFPFPDGLTPADTAHQTTEAATGECGALIPARLSASARRHAEVIAVAARQLDLLRERWLNPPEWTERIPEVVPSGMDRSPYPDRIVAKEGFERQLAQRTLTNLYNLCPAWLTQVHEALDLAVAAAYGWDDYSAAISDDEVLRRLLDLNRTRAGQQSGAQSALPLRLPGPGGLVGSPSSGKRARASTPNRGQRSNSRKVA